jgi:hypothetical protein
MAWFKYCLWKDGDSSSPWHISLCKFVCHSVYETLAYRKVIYHPIWASDCEIHTRFHISGIELLLAGYRLIGGDYWISAVRGQIDVLTAHLTSGVAKGIWFLHDSHEETSQPHAIKTRAFDSSAGNSFTLNTHAYALNVLWQVGKLMPALGSETSRLFESGLRALKDVIVTKPSSRAYSFLESRLNSKPVVNDRAQSAIYRRFWFTQSVQFLLKKIYWRLQARRPRMQMPSGFLQRDLTLSVMHVKYHVINTKDLLMLYRCCSSSWLEEAIHKAVIVCCSINYQVALRHSRYYLELVDVFSLYCESFPTKSNSIKGEIFRILDICEDERPLDFLVGETMNRFWDGELLIDN